MLLHPYVIAMWYGHVIASLCYCNVIGTYYYILMLLQSKFCVKNKVFQAVWMQFSILVASDGIRCHKMSHNNLFYRWICRCNFAKSEPRNDRKDAPTDHSTPQASRSNPTIGGFSVQANRASCVLVRQKTFCQTRTNLPAPGRGNPLQSRGFWKRKKVQTNNLMHYGENNRDKDRQETQE